jgi:hypothetical protein
MVSTTALSRWPAERQILAAINVNRACWPDNYRLAEFVLSVGQNSAGSGHGIGAMEQTKSIGSHCFTLMASPEPIPARSSISTVTALHFNYPCVMLHRLNFTCHSTGSKPPSIAM